MIRKSLVESTKMPKKPLNDFNVVWENFKKYKEATIGEAAELQNFIDSPHMFLTYFENEGITEKQCDEIIRFLNKEICQ